MHALDAAARGIRSMSARQQIRRSKEEEKEKDTDLNRHGNKKEGKDMEEKMGQKGMAERKEQEKVRGQVGTENEKEEKGFMKLICGEVQWGHPHTMSGRGTMDS